VRGKMRWGSLEVVKHFAIGAICQVSQSRQTYVLADESNRAVAEDDVVSANMMGTGATNVLCFGLHVGQLLLYGRRAAAIDHVRFIEWRGSSRTVGGHVGRNGCWICWCSGGLIGPNDGVP
jgi:hypothetical protein